MTTSSKVRAVLALIVAIALGVIIWQSEVKTSNHAKALLANGEKTMAEVTGATIKSRKKYGVTTSRTAEIEYTFQAKDGSTHSGSDDVDAKFVDDISDPADDTRIKDDAAIEIMYLASNPADNGAVAQLSAHREVNYLIILFAALIGAVAVWFVSGRILGFFSRS